MRSKKEEKMFYVILEVDNGSVFKGIKRASSLKNIKKKILMGKIKLKTNPWVWLEGIDKEGFPNNTSHVVNMNHIKVVEIIENRKEYLRYLHKRTTL